jgi:hypothetical protein
MDSFKSLIKGQVYTLSEIENTGIKFIKQTYTGRFYREGNILLVFEEIPERAENKYKLKAIIED